MQNNCMTWADQMFWDWVHNVPSCIRELSLQKTICYLSSLLVKKANGKSMTIIEDYKVNQKHLEPILFNWNSTCSVQSDVVRFQE